MSLRNGKRKFSAAEISMRSPKKPRKWKFFPPISPKLLRELCTEKSPKDFLLPPELIEFVETSRSSLKPSPIYKKDKEDIDLFETSETFEDHSCSDLYSSSHLRSDDLHRLDLSPVNRQPTFNSKSISEMKSEEDFLNLFKDLDKKTPQKSPSHLRNSSQLNMISSTPCSPKKTPFSKQLVPLVVAVALPHIATITEDEILVIHDCTRGEWCDFKLGYATGYQHLFWISSRTRCDSRLYLLLFNSISVRICSFSLANDQKPFMNIFNIPINVSDVVPIGKGELCISYQQTVSLHIWSRDKLSKSSDLMSSTEPINSLCSLNGQSEAIVGCSVNHILIWSYQTGYLIQKIAFNSPLNVRLLCCSTSSGLIVVHRISREDGIEHCQLLAVNPLKATCKLVEEVSYPVKSSFIVNIYDLKKNIFGTLHDFHAVQQLFNEISFNIFDHSIFNLTSWCAEIKYKSRRKQNTV